MLGAIIGDLVGSIYEFNNIKTKNFIFLGQKNHFTDDTIMTIAICSAMIKCKKNYNKLQQITIKELQKFGKKYPNSPKISYGDRFANWLVERNPTPYNSYGNGAAMRISSVPYFAKNIEELKKLVNITTSVTHNHPEGIKGAEATAVCIFMALHGASKEEIKKEITGNYYPLNFSYKDLVENYRFDETCQNTVPQAIYCFLISNSFEDAIRTGISIGGDSDTLCAIIGSIAEAFYGIPENLVNLALSYLDKKQLKYYKLFKAHCKLK